VKRPVRAFGVLTALIAASLLTAGPATAATCSYGSCAGKDPSATDCDTAGAGTISNAVANARITVALRYSSGCDAFWVRHTQAGVNMDGNGCEIADRNGYRGKLQTQKNYPGIGWESFRNYTTTWKSCGDSWDGGDGVGWSRMGEAGSQIRARACWTVDGSNHRCTAWFTRS
jgi:hypothetical protein